MSNSNCLSSIFNVLIFSWFCLGVKIGKGQDLDFYVKCDEHPVFESCAELNSLSEKNQCTEKAIHAFLIQNVKMPREAIENQIMGTVYIEFIVNKNGYIAQPNILKSPHFLLSNATKEVVYKLPKFTPAKHNGVPVKFKYVYPVKFKIDFNEKDLAIIEINEMLENIELFEGTMPRFKECMDLKKDKYIYHCFFNNFYEKLEDSLIYPEELLDLKTNGEVGLKVTINEEGIVSKTDVLFSNDSLFNQAALDAINKLPKLSPAILNSEKVSITFPVVVDVPWYPAYVRSEIWDTTATNLTVYAVKLFENRHGSPTRRELVNSFDIPPVFSGQDSSQTSRQLIYALSNEIKKHFNHELEKYLLENNQENTKNNNANSIISPQALIARFSVTKNGKIRFLNKSTTNYSTIPISELESMFSTLPLIQPAILNSEPVSYQLAVFIQIPQKFDTEIICSTAERVAIFPECECEFLNSKNDQSRCSVLKIIESIKQQIVIPNLEAYDQTQARVYLELTFDKFVDIQVIKVLSGHSEELDSAVVKAAQIAIPRMIPALKWKNPAKFKYTFSIDFDL